VEFLHLQLSCLPSMLYVCFSGRKCLKRLLLVTIFLYETSCSQVCHAVVYLDCLCIDSFFCTLFRFDICCFTVSHILITYVIHVKYCHVCFVYNFAFEIHAFMQVFYQSVVHSATILIDDFLIFQLTTLKSDMQKCNWSLALAHDES